MKLRTAVCLLVTVCWLAACGSSPVANDLSQRESYEIIAALREQGIEASSSKGQGGRGLYSVAVPSSEFGKAVSILHSLGLPAEHKASFSELVAQSSLLPSSRSVEDLRIDRARAAELEDLLRGYPAVVKAHAVVRFQGTDAGASPSVSIVVQRRAGGAFPVAEVSQLVARAVPGIRSEDVVVSVVDELQQPSSGQTKSAAVEGSMVPFLLYWRVAASDYNGLALITIGLLLSVSLMAGLAGYIFGQYNLTRHAEPRHFEPLDSGPRMEQLSAPKDQENDGGRYE